MACGFLDFFEAVDLSLYSIAAEVSAFLFTSLCRDKWVV